MKHDYALFVVRKTGYGATDRVFGIDVAFFDSSRTHYVTANNSAPLIEDNPPDDWRAVWVRERWDIGHFEDEWEKETESLDLAQKHPTVISEVDLLYEFIRLIKHHRRPDHDLVLIDADFGADKLQERINHYGINMQLGETVQMKHFFMGVACLSPETSWDVYEKFFSREVLPNCKPIHFTTDSHVSVYVKHFLYITAYRKMMRKSKENPALYAPQRRFMLSLIFFGFFLGILVQYGSSFF